MRCVLAFVLLSSVLLGLAARAVACPFCTAVKPTFAQQRDAAVIVALAEATGRAGDKWTFRVDQTLKGQKQLAGAESLTIRSDVAATTEGLVLLVGSGASTVAPDALEWTSLPVNETSCAYFARTPDLRRPNGERLRYYAGFLEHADPAIADDAFLEFGHASLDDVKQVADWLPMEQVRRWALDPGIPPGRKGFYGLALGLAATPVDRQANLELLRQQIMTPASDFRAGFDGMLAGFLLLDGDSALELIDQRYLSDPKAADGDVRHALSALRFYQEFGHDVPRERLAVAVRHLLARPEFAATVVADLARWQDWGALDGIVPLYGKPQYADGPTKRAIVAYLRVCPLPKAAEELDRLRKLDQQGVKEAEQKFRPTDAK